MTEFDRDQIEKLKGEPKFQKKLVAALAQYLSSEMYPQSDEIFSMIMKASMGEQIADDDISLETKKAWLSSQQLFQEISSLNSVQEAKARYGYLPKWPDEETMRMLEESALEIFMSDEADTGIVN